MPLCVTFTSEDYLDTDSRQLKVFIGLLAITLVVQDLGSGSQYLHPESFPGWSFKHKTTSLVDTLQIARTVSYWNRRTLTKARKQGQYFARTMNSGGLGHCSCPGRCCCLHDGFQSLNGSSTVTPDMLMSGALQHHQATHLPFYHPQFYFLISRSNF